MWTRVTAAAAAPPPHTRKEGALLGMLNSTLLSAVIHSFFFQIWNRSDLYGQDFSVFKWVFTYLFTSHVLCRDSDSQKPCLPQSIHYHFHLFYCIHIVPFLHVSLLRLICEFENFLSELFLCGTCIRLSLIFLLCQVGRWHITLQIKLWSITVKR